MAKRKTEEEQVETVEPITLTEGPMVGLIVRYVTGGKVRPAIVTAVGEDNVCNLVVFMDGHNDGYAAHNPIGWTDLVQFDASGEQENTWHFVE